MSHFLIWMGGILGTLLLIILVAGQSAGSNFKYETEVIFSVSQVLLWEVMNDVDNYPTNKWGIERFEVLEYMGDIPVIWREYYNFGIVKEYEVIQKNSISYLQLEIKNSLTKSFTTLTFELSEDASKSYLKVTEETTMNNIFYGGLKYLSGKDSYVNSELKWIRVAIQQNLINK